MKVAILDDHSDTLRTLRCFAKLASFEVAASTITSRMSTRSPSG